MKELALKLWKGEDISFGVRILTMATAVRWVGWGFAESLIPVFLFTFAGSYAQTGLLKSSFDIVLILTLPLVGVLADRVRGTTLIIIGLLFYILVGTGYLLAGLTGMAIFIVIARVANGFGASLDIVGRDTYFRRHIQPHKLATVFGYFDTISNFWWMIAALVGIILISFIPIHWLLFAITPTVLIAILLVLRLRRKEPKEIFSEGQERARYRDLFKEVVDWHWKLKALVTMNFLISFAYAVIVFFMPIELYREGSGYTPVIIMGVVSAIPPLFGWVLGDFFDKKGTRVFGYGLLLFGVLLAALGMAQSYLWQIVIVFMVGVTIELLSVGSNELVTTYSNPEHFGRVDGLMRSIANMGGLAGPLAFGIVIDQLGSQVAYLGLSVLMLAVAVSFMVGVRMVRSYLAKKH